MTDITGATADTMNNFIGLSAVLTGFATRLLPRHWIPWILNPNT